MKKVVSFIILIAIVSCIDDKMYRQIVTSLAEEYSNVPRIKIFNNIDSLKSELESITSLEFIEQKNTTKEDVKVEFHTAIYRFGKYSLAIEGSQNEIGYEIFGKEKDIINEINANVSLYTPYQREEAFSHLFEKIEQILKVLNIEQPEDLKESVINGDLCYFEGDKCYLMLTKDIKTSNGVTDNIKIFKFDDTYRVETYKFIIKSK